MESSTTRRSSRGNDGGVQAAFQETLTQARNAVSDTVSDAEQALRDRADRATRSTEKYVQKNPWRALAIAGGIGFLLALLIRR